MNENVMYGPTELSVTDEEIDKIYQEGFLDINENFPPNHYLILRSITNKQKTAITKVNKRSETERLVFDKNFSLSGLKPRDAGQYAFAHSLLDPKIKISTAIGGAGTGKTSVALGYALDAHFSQKNKIYLTKPTALVSNFNNAFGPVPGDVQDKYAPYIQSFSIVLENLLGEKSKSYIQMLFKNKAIQYIPIEYSRGCTFKDCTFIVDEVQNLTWHELKTIVSRMGENTKLILTGDPHQIDRPFSLQESGLYTMISSEAYKKSDFTAINYLTAQYRGPMATLVLDIDKEQGSFSANTIKQTETKS